jgi:AcrR family transcriptional regulator
VHYVAATHATERQPILSAMVQVVGEKGYRDTSVADVVEAAGATPAAFHANFEDKQECFLAAYEMLTEQFFAQLRASREGQATWLDQVHASLATIIELFALDPALARTAVVEVAVAGPEARQLYWEAIARLGEQLDPGRELLAGEEVPEHVSLMAAGAVAGLIFDELIRGRAAELPALLPDLVFVTLVPYLGPHAAALEMERAAAQRDG